MNISEIIKAISNNINLYNSYISYPNLVTEIVNHPNNEITITPYIEITNNCNLACDFCIKNKRIKKYMSFDEFKTILNKGVNFSFKIKWFFC